MGYDEDFKIPVSDTQAYRQFGNSVVIPVVTDIAKQLVDFVNDKHDVRQFDTMQQLKLPNFN